jgi:ribonucleotide reductase alpha subunit
MDMAADRSPWIDQSQSLNHHVADPDDNMLSTILMYGWEKGLKTGSYYLRRKALVDAQKFSVDINHQASQVNQPEIQVCSIDNPDCLACQG